MELGRLSENVSESKASKPSLKVPWKKLSRKSMSSIMSTIKYQPVWVTTSNASLPCGRQSYLKQGREALIKLHRVTRDSDLEPSALLWRSCCSQSLVLPFPYHPNALSPIQLILITILCAIVYDHLISATTLCTTLISLVQADQRRC